MRELKFRAWDNERKTMIDGTDIEEFTDEKDDTHYHTGLSYGKLFVAYFDKKGDWQECPIMQYTGLKDKNGRDIYEGDVLKVCNGSINGCFWWDKSPWTVTYQNGRGFTIPAFCWTPEGNDDMDSTHFCEVIGNIYENPELLQTL